ncbi:MAG TPA: RDD family protein [Acidimicrobiales bacterium]
MSDEFPPPPPPPQDPDRPGDPYPPPPPQQQPPPGYQQGGYQQYEPYPQQPQPGGRPVDNFGRPLADWWKRLVAAIIDGIVIAVPSAIVVVVFLGASVAVDTGTGDLVAGFGSFVFTLVIGVASIAYYVVLDGGPRGQTLGKMALSIQVRDEVGGGPIGYGRGALRRLLQFVANFIPCFGSLIVILDGLWPLWDPKRQALHDKIARSVVIDISR